LSPITPSLSIAAYQQLGLDFNETTPPDWSHTNWGILKIGKPLANPNPIFQRIENN
jgi:methionyl-tRNA synthetase